MTLHIELPPQLESELLVAAGQQGVSAGDYALSVLRTALTAKPSCDLARLQEPFYSRASVIEWQRAFAAWVESHRNVAAPALSNESLRRESMYDERGA
jgi:hypothetical protein